MKLVIAVVQDYDVDRLLTRLIEDDFRATRIASTGGYLRTGNTTLLLGVADNRLRRCLELLASQCRTRIDRPRTNLSPDLAELYAAGLAHVTIGGSVAFVAHVERHVRIE